MNQNGRVVGSVLVGLALLWLLRIVGAFPFSNSTTNQLNQDQAAAQTPPNRPLIQDFDASRTGVAELNPGTGTGIGNLDTPGTGSDDLAQTPGTGSGSGTGNTSGTNTSGAGLSPGASTRPTTPALPAAW